jgi:hypothetical protein
VVVLLVVVFVVAIATKGSFRGLVDPTMPPGHVGDPTTTSVCATATTAVPATATTVSTTTMWTTTTSTTTTSTTTTSTTTTSTTVTSITTSTTSSRRMTSTTLPLFTKERPLRVLEVGDSLATYPGYALRKKTGIYAGLRVESITKQSSGLARPDYYNWPQVLAHAVADFRPHVTVVLLGANDNQPLGRQGRSFRTFSDEWKAEYERRVENFLQICTQAGSSVIWVGLPIMKSRGFSETERKLNELYQAGCAAHPGALYLDGYALFANGDGEYAARLLDTSGEDALMRARDGIHFTMAGADRIADAVMQVLLSRFRLERAAEQ